MFGKNITSDLLRLFLIDQRPIDGESFLLRAKIITEFREQEIIPKYNSRGLPFMIEDFNNSEQHLQAAAKIKSLRLDSVTFKIYADTYGQFCSFLRGLSMGAFICNNESWQNLLNK
jgi:hypothetical protein